MNAVMNLQHRNITLADLLAGITEISTKENRAISGIQIDSRNITPGELFVALPGARQHGNAYIGDAIRSGAAAVIVDARTAVTVDASVPLIKVADIAEQAGVIASRFYGEPSQALTVIGITGTNGKTTCSVLLAQALHKLGAHPGVIGTLGAGLWGQLSMTLHTTPDAVTLQKHIADIRDQGGDYLVMEVSSHGLQQARVNGTAFNLAVFTNLSQDHLDYHSTMQQYGAAKAKLFQQHSLQQAVINSDDEFGKQLLAGPISAERAISYGIESGDVHAQQLNLHSGGMQLEVNSPWGSLQIESPLMGRFNAYNLLACTAVLLATGYSPTEIENALSGAESASGRMECFHSGKITVVVDFAHTPDALEQALSALREHNPGRQLICVFGCGGDRDQVKRPLMGRIAEQLADKVILTDDNPRHEDAASIRADIAAGMQQSPLQMADRRQAIITAWQMAESGDIILIAGKGHETTQQVGDLKIPFSDREVVLELLGERA